jgi:hypothetical protein
MSYTCPIEPGTGDAIGVIENGVSAATAPAGTVNVAAPSAVERTPPAAPIVALAAGGGDGGWAVDEDDDESAQDGAASADSATRTTATRFQRTLESFIRFSTFARRRLRTLAMCGPEDRRELVRAHVPSRAFGSARQSSPRYLPVHGAY